MGTGVIAQHPTCLPPPLPLPPLPPPVQRLPSLGIPRALEVNLLHQLLNGPVSGFLPLRVVSAVKNVENNALLIQPPFAAPGRTRPGAARGGCIRMVIERKPVQ